MYINVCIQNFTMTEATSIVWKIKYYKPDEEEQEQEETNKRNGM